MKRHIVERLLVACIILSGCQIDQIEVIAKPPPPVAPPPSPVVENVAPASKWTPLAQDGLHDPTNPRLNLLQNPEEALSMLPPDLDGNARSSVVGNQVKWVKALEEGYINPRTNIYPETKIKILDMDVMLMKRNSGELGRVLFPHKQHTEWLDCSNCHEWLFKSKIGANNITMFAILDGEFCGRCHGAVAFPLTQCQRCHSVPFSEPIPAGARIKSAETQNEK